MKPRAAVLLALAAVLAVAGAAWLRSRPGGPPPPPGPARDGGRGSPDTPPPPPPGRLDARVFRSRDEVILLARRVEDGRPAPRAEVLVLDEAGGVCARGTTDLRGVFRGRFEGDPRSLSLQEAEEPALVRPLPRAPVSPPRGPPVLADRSVLRPGDALRVCAWLAEAEVGAPPGLVRLDPEDPRVTLDLALAEDPRGAASPLPDPRWWILEVVLPHDVRPGIVVVEVGNTRLEVPVLPRFGPPPEEPLSAPAAEDGDPEVNPYFRRVDGGWRVRPPVPAEGTPVLVFSSAGDRFLSHGSALVEEGAVVVPLPEESVEEEVVVSAVIATASGFLDFSAAVPPRGPVLRIEPLPSGPRGGEFGVRVLLAEEGRPGAPALSVPVPLAAAADDPSGSGPAPSLRCDDAASLLDLPLEGPRGTDLRVRALALPRGGPPLAARATLLAAEPAAPPAGPAWIYEGDRPADGSVPPPARPVLVPVRVFLPADAPTLLRGVLPIPPAATVAWTAVGTRGPGALRLRGARGILLETRIEPGRSTGTLDAGSPGPDRGLLVASSDAPGFAGLLLEAEVPADPARVPAEHAPGLSLERLLPDRGTEGSRVEAVLVLRAAAALEGPIEVLCPLPRGALPAEDGWRLRSASPAGTRVRVEEDAVSWTLPGLPPGETRVAVPLRLAWRGRWAVPPATARSADPAGPACRSAGASLVVE